MKVAFNDSMRMQRPQSFLDGDVKNQLVRQALRIFFIPAALKTLNKSSTNLYCCKFEIKGAF